MTASACRSLCVCVCASVDRASPVASATRTWRTQEGHWGPDAVDGVREEKEMEKRREWRRRDEEEERRKRVYNGQGKPSHAVEPRSRRPCLCLSVMSRAAAHQVYAPVQRPGINHNLEEGRVKEEERERGLLTASSHSRLSLASERQRKEGKRKKAGTSDSQLPPSAGISLPLSLPLIPADATDADAATAAATTDDVSRRVNPQAHTPLVSHDARARAAAVQ